MPQDYSPLQQYQPSRWNSRINAWCNRFQCHHEWRCKSAKLEINTNIIVVVSSFRPLTQFRIHSIWLEFVESREGHGLTIWCEKSIIGMTHDDLTEHNVVTNRNRRSIWCTREEDYWEQQRDESPQRGRMKVKFIGSRFCSALFEFRDQRPINLLMLRSVCDAESFENPMENNLIFDQRGDL